MKETPQILDHGIETTCGKCGHKASIDLFMSTPLNGDLPDTDFQCPSCMTAVRRGHAKPNVYNQYGGKVSGGHDIIEIAGVL